MLVQTPIPPQGASRGAVRDIVWFLSREGVVMPPNHRTPNLTDEIYLLRDYSSVQMLSRNSRPV